MSSDISPTQVSPASSQSPVVEGQVWEKDGRMVRVIRAHGGEHAWRVVSVRDIESGSFVAHPEKSFLATFRYVPIRAEDVLWRVRDLIRRTDVSDAEFLVDALEVIVLKSKRADAHANADRNANPGI